ncbi:MAG: NAD(P)/FAD-dependent oxidoreductase [Chlorobiaceae bacterium]|nr:NAD(P)/FAD-dependent oxidoreductase [Chlorobiaceae bacterium]
MKEPYPFIFINHHVLSMNHFDVIVIGGGLGGLTAGAKLAREGRSVLLIEQHSVPGGCATTFKRHGFLVEGGLHELDGLDSEDPKKVIFEELGVFDRLEFVKIPEFYRVVSSKSDLVVPDNADQAINVFIKAFPDEEKGIRKFFRTISAIRKEIDRLPSSRLKMALLFPFFPLLFPNLVTRSRQTIGGFVDGIIRNEELKLALLTNFPYYHDDPYSLSLLYFSVAQSSFYRGGGHFIKGGSQRLSDHLAGVITANGGRVMLNTMVTRIITEHGRAAGVAFRQKHNAEEGIEKADAIVANAAIPLVESMLPEPERMLLRGKTAGLKNSCSILSVYIGFRRDISVLNNRAYSTFIIGDGVTSLKAAASGTRADFEHRGFVFVDYSRIDSGLGAEGKSLGVICTVDYLDEWEGLDDDEYRRKKEAVGQIFVRRLEKIMPGIGEEIEYVELGTSKTIKRFTLNPGGAIYGYAQTPEQSGMFRLPNRSNVPNLYFASAWSNPGGGFTGAILSGWFCAKEVLSSKT